jgi:hypothetical protein
VILIAQNIHIHIYVCRSKSEALFFYYIYAYLSFIEWMGYVEIAKFPYLLVFHSLPLSHSFSFTICVMNRENFMRWNLIFFLSLLSSLFGTILLLNGQILNVRLMVERVMVRKKKFSGYFLFFLKSNLFKHFCHQELKLKPHSIEHTDRLKSHSSE